MKHQSYLPRILVSRLTLVVLAGSLTALAGGSTTWANGPNAAPAGYKLFTSKVIGYRMVYPARWSAKGVSGTSVFRGPTDHGIPTEVTVTPLGVASTFGTVDVLGGTFTQSFRKEGMTHIGDTKTRVAGNDALEITGQGKSQGGVLEHAAVVVFVGHSRAWAILYTATSTQYARTSGEFRTMVSSFAFIK